MRVSRFKKIKDHRVFAEWPSQGSDFKFARLSVGYAENGSGKSSFASLLKPEQSPEAWGSGVELEVLTPSKKIITDPVDPMLQDIVVFNRAYIQSAVSLENGGEMSVLHLGGAAVQHAKKQAEMFRTVQAALNAQKVASQALAAALAPYKSTRTEVAREIKSALGGHPHYSGYTAARLPKDFTAPTQASNDSPERRRRLAEQAVSQAIGSLPISSTYYALPNVDWAEIQDILCTESVSVDSLEPSLKEWLERGLELHNESDVCAFCLGPLNVKRVADLRDIIETADRNFQGRLVRARQSVELAQDSATQMLRIEQLNPQLTYPSLRSEVPAANEEQLKIVQRIADGLDKVAGMINSKIAAPSEKLPEFPKSTADGKGAIPTWYSTHSPLMRKLELAHVAMTSDLESSRRRAATELEGLIIDSHLPKLTGTKKKLGSATETQAIADGEVDFAQAALEAHAAAAEGTEHGPGVINNRLHRILGRQDLKVSAQIDASGTERYVLTRNGLPATSLSEGEHTALAVIHFVVSIDDKGRDPASVCVVVDDPISSLDQNVSYGISALLWDELVGPVCNQHNVRISECDHQNIQSIPRVGQLILLTHDFTLFKNWSQKTDAIGKSWLNGDKVIFELTTVRSAGREAEPRFEALNDDRLRQLLRSEYHYLFNRAANTLAQSASDTGSVDDRRDAILLIPNALRRLIDAFLSHFDPESLTAQSGKTFRQRVTSVRSLGTLSHPELVSLLPLSDTDVLVEKLNELSHLEESGAMPWQPRPSIDYVTRCCFDFMFAADPGHVTRTARALKLNLEDLVRSPLISAYSDSQCSTSSELYTNTKESE